MQSSGDMFFKMTAENIVDCKETSKRGRCRSRKDESFSQQEVGGVMSKPALCTLAYLKQRPITKDAPRAIKAKPRRGRGVNISS
ncbi:hypothetical protein PoB_005604900 [Plakobranchus ocellatus]|uniref:Uncharacterized protein n=1 Tax=Plakobranchus ocellatus TaxID=259542 RepID=A0AAV4CEH5_9GAST|nr:hypothetical protein PoB_005604900 [Plakobranchus ocellatus]